MSGSRNLGIGSLDAGHPKSEEGIRSILAIAGGLRFCWIPRQSEITSAGIMRKQNFINEDQSYVTNLLERT